MFACIVVGDPSYEQLKKSLDCLLSRQNEFLLISKENSSVRKYADEKFCDTHTFPDADESVLHWFASRYEKRGCVIFPQEGNVSRNASLCRKYNTPYKVCT